VAENEPTGVRDHRSPAAASGDGSRGQDVASRSAALILWLAAFSAAALLFVVLIAGDYIVLSAPSRSNYRFFFRQWAWSAVAGLGSGIAAATYLNWLLRNQRDFYLSWLRWDQASASGRIDSLRSPYSLPFLASIILLVVISLAARLAVGTAILAWWAGMLIHALVLRGATQASP
jgi:hypothetical protein